MTNESTLTSADLIKRSEELRQQAQEMMRREMPEVITRIKEAIAHYGLTAADLGLAGAPGAAGAASSKAPRKATAKRAGAKRDAQGVKPRRAASAKYRDDQGNHWSGFGPKPRWLKDALAAGVSEESLRA